MTKDSDSKIIHATIECIEKYGIQGATNRRISEMAGVNSAAINYYFRRKKVLIDYCMSVTLKNAFDFDNFGDMPGATPRERCAVIFNDLITGGLNYPNITRAHFYPLLVDGKYQPEVVKYVNRFVEELAADFTSRGCGLPPDELRLACTQALMTVLMAVLTPGLFADGVGIDLREPEDRRRFVERLVERLF
jgi:AcrR family transcriptional regulator